ARCRRPHRGLRHAALSSPGTLECVRSLDAVPHRLFRLGRTPQRISSKPRTQRSEVSGSDLASSQLAPKRDLQVAVDNRWSDAARLHSENVSAELAEAFQDLTPLTQ